MHNSDYSHIYIGDEKGISIEEVRLALGETARDVKGLCISGMVNKWARNKPIDVPGFYGIPTAARRSAANFGMDLSDGADGCRATGNNALVQVLEKALANDADWKYTPPGAIFRLADFDGYRNGAGLPYAAVASETGGLTKTFNLARNANGLYLRDCGDLLVDGALSDCKIVLILRMQRAVGLITEIESEQTLDALTDEAAQFAVNFPANSISVYERYDCIFAVKQVVPNVAVHYWYYPLKWTYNVFAYDGLAMFEANIPMGAQGWLTVTKDAGGIVQGVSVAGRVANNASGLRYVRVTLSVYNAQSGLRIGSTVKDLQLASGGVSFITLDAQILSPQWTEVFVSVGVWQNEQSGPTGATEFWCDLTKPEVTLGTMVRWIPSDTEVIVSMNDV